MAKNMTKISWVGVTVLFSALAVGLPSAEALAFQEHGSKAKAKEHKKEHKKDHKAGDKAHKAEHKAEKKDDRRHNDTHVFDRDGHHRVIREYGHGGSLPPGLAKRESLPPGLRRQLRERGTLPPGLQKRLVLVPGDLGTHLPAVPSYYTRYFAGDDLIIVDTRTNTIAAIVRDVWR